MYRRLRLWKLIFGVLAIVLGESLWSRELCCAEEMLNLESATHKPMHSIKPVLDNKTLRFHTFKLCPAEQHEPESASQLWLCCTSNSDPSRGVLLVYDVEGVFQRSIEVPFVPTAIDFSSNDGVANAVFVAGGGRVAKLSLDGKVLELGDAPNLGNREEALAAMREEAKNQIGDLLVGVEKQAERVKKQISQLETAVEGETAEQETRRLRRLKLLRQQVKQIQLTIDSVRSGEAGVNESSLSRLELASSMAVSKQFVFVSLPTVTGYGYDVWRLDHNLSQPKKIIERGSGCCGQFDIQTDGTHLVVAENCDFRVAYYDSEGTPVKHFGKRSAKEADGFGSCCNPMNVCCQGDEVLTAESSIGHIKRFSSDGKLLAYIGTAPIGGGCKHVALAHDKVTDRYFMFNEDRKCISVLIPKSQAAEESEDERAARVAMQGLGKQLLGSWQIASSEGDAKSDSELAEFLGQKYGALKFAENGKLDGPAFSQGLKPESRILAVLAKLSGSGESAKLMVQPVSQAAWTAIEQQEQKLRIGFVEDGVTSFQGSVQFSDPNTMTIGFSFGSSNTVAELKYQRSNN